MKLPIRMLPVLGVALVIALGPASAQERLETVLERGYAVEWLVCGPLPSDLPGGILEAVDKGTLPLSETDYLAGMGGVSRARPKAQAKIDVGGVSSEWTELRAEGPALDLTGLFVDRRQGVAYAAFYTHSDWARTVYFDIQTPLGARIWVNGFPARNVRATPLSAAGLDRFTADLRVGRNLIMIQAPLADVESMASRASLTPREFRARTFRNRPLLTDTTGFEMGLRILPAQPVGPLIVVPRLEAMGSFSGKAGAMHQDALLTLFNPEGSLSNTIGVTMSVVGVAEPVKQAILPIAPQTQKEALLSIPIGDASPGQSVDVQVTVTSGRDSVSFPARLNARRAPSQGKMFVVTGGRYRAGTSEDQRARVKRRMDEIDRNLVLLENEPDYGFDLAEAEAWESHWLTRPAMRDRLADAANLGRAAPHAGYSLPDERIVGGEVLVRNLAYGHFTADALLARRGGCYLAWNAVGVCPQLPQILAKTTGLGVISALPVRGLPAVFQQLGPDGSAMVHRRREPSRAPASATDLRELAIVQRRELLHLGLDTDVLVVESDVPPPEPFYLGACRDLARSVPSVRVTGSGGEEFLLAAQEAVEQQGLPVPRAGRAMTATEPGMLLAQPAIKQAHTRVESILITTEKLATLAALQGARYPHHTLDYAWRQVIYNSRVDRLGLAPTPGVYLDMLAGYRDAEAVTRRTLNASTAFLASRVNTYAGLQSNKEGAMAFVVFNPSSWIRTDVCDANVSLPRSRGFTVLDDQGDPVPFTLSDPGTAGSRLQVVATDVPPLGYRTYYLMPEGRPVQPTTDDGLVIENDYYRVEIDRAQGGGIALLTAKKTGEEYARGLLNDVIALEELAELNNSGKDFWTTNARYRAGVGSAEIERTLSLTSQRLHITVPLLGGVLTRTISLSPGVERIDCTVRFEGVPIDGRTLGLVFEIWGQGRAPVFGERFGAVVGRTCLDPYNLQTAQGDNPSGTALQPALRWMAVAPGDHIEAGIDMHIPLLPCQIVHGPDPLYARFARDLQDTLVMRGIPATVSSDTPPKLDVIWTDSTQFGALDDELRYGASMRILIGMPDQNALCKSIVASLDETDRAELHKRLAESGAAYIYHDTGRETGRIPTLILAGNTPAAAEAVVAEAVESIRSGGVFRIRPQDNLGQRATSPPTTGFAVLTRGATVCNAGRNGVIFLGLAHGSQWTRATGGPPAPPGASALEVEYALYPFSGTWREAAVPRAGHAFNEAFVGVVTTPHPGPMPLSQSFVTPTYPDFIVTALKPTGYPLIDAMGDEDMPALGGVTVRGYDSYGTPARVSLRFGVPARGATRSNLLELNRMPLNTSGGAITAHVSPFGIETFTAVPNAVRQNADSPDLDALPDAPRPLFTRYWQNNEGAPPMGYRSLTLLLDGDLSKASSSIRVTLANNDTQDRAAGTVTLTGPQSWSIAPMQFDYALAPGERLERQVVVLSHGGPGEDGIVAQTRLGGRTYMDVLTQRVPAIGVTVERSGAEVVATVANKSSLPAAGWVDLIAPPIAWPNPSGGDPGVRPHRQTVAVAAYDEQRLVFRVPTDPAPPWLTLKLAANGEVQYMPVPTAAEAPAP